MKWLSPKKILGFALAGMFLTVLGFTLSTGVAHAAGGSIPDLLSCGANAFTCAVYGISFVVNAILGLFISLGAYIITFALNLDGNVFNSPTVQTGFSIALSVANLGFVLGIIVIAIATILRSEAYGVKQMLWKLVVMAILVNFGLVITAPIVGFADNLSNYFVNAEGGTISFATNLTNAFAPQNLMQPPPAATGGQTACNVAGGLLGGPVGAALCNTARQYLNGDTSGASAFMVQVLSLIFSAVFSFIVMITFFAIGIMLFIRYIYLALLLVLLPLAWLTWVLPKLSHHFERWLSEFFKWTFFPVISLFFIYIAFQSVTNINGAVGLQAASIASSNPNGPLASMATQTGGNVNLIQTALDELLMAGLCLGGLFAANAMSIKGADTAMSIVKGAGKGVKNWTTRQTKKAGRATYQRLGGNTLNKKMQAARVPIIPTIGRQFASWTEAGGKDLVGKRAADLKLSGMSDERLVEVTKGLREKPDQFAALAEWQKRNKLYKVEQIGGTDLNTFLDKNESLAKSGYDQGKLMSDINKNFGNDADGRRISRARAAEMEKVDVVDSRGIVAAPGTKVSAADLAGGAKVVIENAKEAIKEFGLDTTVNHNGRIVRADTLIEDAHKSIADADDAADKVEVKDEKGLLGPAGKMQRAGELLQAASDKFVKGLDKGDFAKTHPDYLFEGEGKFGLDENTVRGLGRAFAQSIVSTNPLLISSAVGKLDKEDEIKSFMREITKAIDNAVATNHLTKKDANRLQNQYLGRSIEKRISNIATGGGGGGAAPAAPSGGGGGGGH